MTKILKPLNITEIEEEYKPYEDIIFNSDPQKIHKIKKIIFNDLDIVERRIILLYADKASMREVGKQLGISTSKTHQIITAIRNKIKQYLKQNDTPNNP
jgi:DNA-directed RNA polymerase specialized sigma subunit